MLVAAVSITLAACGGQSGPERPRPRRGEAFSRPLEIYRDLGFMTGPGQFPVVASFGTIAGPADSTYVVLGLSMPNSALRFQRDSGGFFAEYTINLTFMDADSATVKRFETRETVRIPTFAETGRTDESVVYQQAIAVPAGSYIVQLQAADANSSRGFRMTDTLTVPAFERDGIGSPMIVYEAKGRTARGVMPELILNPRHTVPYGGESPRVYIESYGGGDAPLDVKVTNESGATVWTGAASLSADAPVRYAIVEIPASALPLGKFFVEVGQAGATAGKRPLVMTISEQWMVANFDEVLQFLRYIAYPEEIDSLRTGDAAQRREAWERFWARRDPLPITQLNEYRDGFFQRVRHATEAFREPGGRAGWATDRGEVYIVLGAPEQAVERYIDRNDRNDIAQPNAEEWVYSSVPGGRLHLLFHDRTGFGRYELIPSSAAAFRTVAERMKPRLPRN